MYLNEFEKFKYLVKYFVTDIYNINICIKYVKYIYFILN